MRLEATRRSAPHKQNEIDLGPFDPDTRGGRSSAVGEMPAPTPLLSILLPIIISFHLKKKKSYIMFLQKKDLLENF